MSNATPEKIGKYQIESIIGRGGMGEVYKALDASLHRHVALKIMRSVSLDDTNSRERFVREAQAAGGLRHPNIVTIYDLGEHENVLYIVMEWIQGDDMERIIKDKTEISLDDKLNIMIQVCEGVGYAHKHQIVHRDLKPANIRIDDQGIVKIMDFGIAKLETSNMTASGTVMGTPFYMSPEQVRGMRVDARSDIFALGAILYEILTFKKAFYGDVAVVFYKITMQEPKPLSEFLNIPTEPLQAIIDGCLQKEKAKRIQSAAEVAGMLRSVQQIYRDSNVQTIIGGGGSEITIHQPEYHLAQTPSVISGINKPTTRPGLTKPPTQQGIATKTHLRPEAPVAAEEVAPLPTAAPAEEEELPALPPVTVPPQTRPTIRQTASSAPTVISGTPPPTNVAPAPPTTLIPPPEAVQNPPAPSGTYSQTVSPPIASNKKPVLIALMVILVIGIGGVTYLF